MEKNKINYAVLKLLQDEYKNNNNFFDPNTLFIKANKEVCDPQIWLRKD